MVHFIRLEYEKLRTRFFFRGSDPEPDLFFFEGWIRIRLISQGMRFFLPSEGFGSANLFLTLTRIKREGWW